MSQGGGGGVGGGGGGPSAAPAPFSFDMFFKRTPAPPSDPSPGDNDGDAPAAPTTSTTTPKSSGHVTALPTSPFHVSYRPPTSDDDADHLPQPHTTPIAHFNASPAASSTGASSSHVPSSSLVDTNDNYIAYVVKGGLLRVLDKTHARKTLLRGHAAAATPLVDVSFVNARSDVLATVGGLASGDGDDEDGSGEGGGESGSGVVIWRLFPTAGDDNGGIGQEKLLEIRMLGGGGGAADDGHDDDRRGRSSVLRRILWHPFNTNLFLLVHGPTATLVESTRLFTARCPDEGHHMCHLDPSPTPRAAVNESKEAALAEEKDGSPGGKRKRHVNRGRLQLRGHSGTILDADWCRMAAQFVLTGGSDGTVRLWNLRETSTTSPPDAGKVSAAAVVPSARCVWTIRPPSSSGGRGDDAVTRCLFLPLASPPSAEGGAPLTGPFLVGTRQNARVTLYSPHCVSASSREGHNVPVPLKIFEFDPANSSSSLRFNLALCCSPQPPSDQPPSGDAAPAAAGMGGGGGGGGGGECFALFSDRDGGYLHALHLTSTGSTGTGGGGGGGTGGRNYAFDCVSPYRLLHPVLSWSVTGSPRGVDDDMNEDEKATLAEIGNDGNEDDAHRQWDMCCYSIQTRACQILKLRPHACVLPAPGSKGGDGRDLAPGVEILEMDPPKEGAPAVVGEEAAAVVTEEEEGEGGEEYELSDAEDDDEDDDDDAILVDASRPSPSAISSVPSDEKSPGRGAEEKGVVAASGGGGGGPFANWLGHIAAKPSSSAAAAPTPAPAPAPAAADEKKKKKPKTAKSGAAAAGAAVGSIGNVPLPPNPPATPASSSAAVAAAGQQQQAPRKSPSPLAGSLLSPMELLPSTSSASSSTATSGKGGQQQQRGRGDAKSKGGQKQQPAAAGRSPPRGNRRGGTTNRTTPQRNQSPAPPKGGGGGGGRQGKGGATAASTTPPTSAPAIKILTRDPDVPPPGIAAAAAPPTTSAQSAAAPSDVEGCLRRVLTAHFASNGGGGGAMSDEAVRVAVRDEVKSAVVPAVTSAVREAVREQQQQDEKRKKKQRGGGDDADREAEALVGKIVTALGPALSEAVGDASRGTSREVAEAVSRGVRGPVEDAFHKAMREVMIPAYEATTQEMFRQIASSVEANLAAVQMQARQRGAQEDEASRLQQQQQQQALMSLSSSMEAMRVSVDSLATEVAGLRSLVAEQAAAANNGAASAASSSAASAAAGGGPPPTYERIQAMKAEIVDLFRAGEFEAAFTKALSERSVEMAIFACRCTDLPSILQREPPALSQPVLLCLMQQLGSMLLTPPGAAGGGGDAELTRAEVAWLQEIAVTLDPTDASISLHLGEVLRQLVDNINAKLAQGDPTLRRPLQMLLQVVRGMTPVR